MTTKEEVELETVSATEFKAKCLDLIDQVGSRQIGRLEITKRGKVVAILVPPPDLADAAHSIHGFMRGSVIIPDGFDLTAPVLDEPLDADGGAVQA